METNSTPIDSLAPLGIALLAALLIEEGHDVKAIDGIVENASQILPVELNLKVTKKIPKYSLSLMGLTFDEIASMIDPEVEIIGISSMFSINWVADRALIAFLAERFPKAKIIAGGESISSMPEFCMTQAPALEVCVLGEGEETLIALLNAFIEKSDLSQIEGIMYRDGEHFVKTKRRSRIRNVDSVPIPAWHLFPIDKYSRYTTISGEEPRKTLPLLATRGCPYECTFCTSPDMWGTRYFMRTPALVADEIAYLKETYNITNFEFYDLTAIIQKRWVIEFAKILLDRKLDITWKIPAGTRSEAIDAEVASYLKKSGCFFITYAPESGSERMLKLIKKKVDLDNILKSMGYSSQEGMIIFINMILALPDEKHKDVWATLRFLVKCGKANINDLALAIFRPYPGSVLFTRMIEEGKVQLDDDDYFVESILIIDKSRTSAIFNDNVSAFSYSIYYVLAYVAFYGAKYVYKPKSFFAAVKNIYNNQTNSVFEQKVANRLRQMLYVKS